MWMNCASIAELEKERAFYQGRLDAAAEEQRLALEKQCLELTDVGRGSQLEGTA